jgi:hypothetical protein
MSSWREPGRSDLHPTADGAGRGQVATNVLDTRDDRVTDRALPDSKELR